MYVVCVSTTKGYPDVEIYCVTNAYNVFEFLQMLLRKIKFYYKKTYIDIKLKKVK